MPQNKILLKQKKNIIPHQADCHDFIDLLKLYTIHIPRNGLCFFNEDYHVDLS